MSNLKILSKKKQYKIKQQKLQQHKHNCGGGKIEKIIHLKI